jgi:hypothetical protein
MIKILKFVFGTAVAVIVAFISSLAIIYYGFPGPSYQLQVAGLWIVLITFFVIGEILTFIWIFRKK